MVLTLFLVIYLFDKAREGDANAIANRVMQHQLGLLLIAYSYKYPDMFDPEKFSRYETGMD